MQKKYSYSQVLEASTKYFDGDEFAAKVFTDKYALQNLDGEFFELTPDDMHKRLAKEFARIEAKYPNPMSEEHIYNLIKDFKYIVPQGSPMAAIGNNFQTQSLSNCFVINGLHSEKYDSYGGIMLADQELAQIMKRRGGVGLDISGIRPKGLLVNNAARTTDGIGVFMERYSNTCREVAQCIAKGERVLTKNGLKPIEEVIPNEDKVWTKIGWVNVNKILSNKKKVYTIVTKNNYTISASEDHVFLISDNFTTKEVKLKDLKLGDDIVLIPGTTITKDYVKLNQCNTQKITSLNATINQPTHLNEDLAYLIGYLYGDGSVSYNKLNEPMSLSLACSHDYPEIESKLISIIKDQFKYEPNVTKGDGALNCIDIHRKVIAMFLKENDLLKEKAKYIKLPSKIFNSPSTVQFAFLAGFFDADGTAKSTKKGYSFSTINNKFAKDIKLLLMANGIPSSFYVEDRSDRNWCDISNVNVVGLYAQTRFIEYMSKFSCKVNSSKFISKRDNILTPFNANGLNIKTSHYNFIPDNTQHISLSAFSKLNLNENPLIIDEIVAIIDGKEVDTYDLCLNEEHLFWCEGFYVHNSGRRGALMITVSINHPDIETFINIKKDLKKVTGANISIRLTDEFMNAVKNDTDYTLRYPVDSTIENAKSTKIVKAKDIWNQIIDSAWTAAEPGLLFWDNVKKTTPSDIYKDFGHESISTNPCFHGDTLIAVADGRNYVSIKQLVDEGKDVAVYSLNRENGMIEIKMGRNPRLTGTDKELVRVWLDDDSFIDTTPDHKFVLLNGDKVEAKDLKIGDSLPRFTKALEPVKTGSKDYYRIYTNTLDSSKDKIFEHRLISKFYNEDKWNVVYSSIKENGFAKTGGLVVHHKDYNQLNNSPDNLEIMTFSEHSKLHGEIDNSGEKNGNYSGVSFDELKKHGIILTKQFNRRFSIKEWQAYAKDNNLPVTFSDFRKDKLGSVIEFAKLCAAELGLEYIDSDPRVVNSYKNMLSQGYEARIEDNTVLVKRVCELCGKTYEIEHTRREGSVCSIYCQNNSLNRDQFIKQKRDKSRDAFNSNKMENIKKEQARVYSKLKFDLKRDPLMKEWEDACKQEKLPCRIGKALKFGFKNFKEVAEAGSNFNHKVARIEKLDGLHNVYNITVDDYHTVAVITKINNKRNNQWFSGILVSQCGEIVLPKNDACRLLTLNLTSYIESPFTSEAKFDFDMFNKHAVKAQRLMDDIIDLEIESVDKIIQKVKSDPEPEEAKIVELNLWQKIREMNISGRRTGLGITGLGDCLAMLNIKYGSTESIDMTSKIYRALAVAAHTSSCVMAKERGSFPIFSYDLEKDHEYLNSIMNDCDLETKELWKKYGRRNIALTTTAPTGSVSALTQTTSGIEPAFLLSYVRRKKINPSDKNSQIDFIDELGDKWQEFTVYHHGVKQWMDVTGETDITKSPYWGATSNEIDWKASVELQAAAQKSIDHSISKTCVTADTLIETNNGLMYMDEIIDFSAKNTSIENVDFMVKNCDYSFTTPSHVHVMDYKKIIEVTLDNGLKIKVSPGERFLHLNEESGLDEWKVIESLSSGDRVKVK